MYPYSNAEIWRSLESPGLVVSISPTPSALRAEFEAAARSLFGSYWEHSGFYKTHEMPLDTPLMGEAQVKPLFHAFYPHEPVERIDINTD